MLCIVLGIFVFFKKKVNFDIKLYRNGNRQYLTCFYFHNYKHQFYDVTYKGGILRNYNNLMHKKEIKQKTLEIFLGVSTGLGANFLAPGFPSIFYSANSYANNHRDFMWVKTQRYYYPFFDKSHWCKSWPMNTKKEWSLIVKRECIQKGIK